MAEFEAEPQPCFLPSLAGLRGAAALMIVAVHAMPVLAPDAPGWLAGLVAHGQVAVDLFFVLSGFVLGRAEAGLRRAGVGAFLWRRAWRLWPLHAAVLGGLALYVLAAGDGFDAPDFPWARLGPTLLLVGPFVERGASGWNAPAWSVAVEMMCAGLLWPALAGLRAAGRPRLVAGAMAGVAAAAIVACGGGTWGWAAALRGACGFGFGVALARAAASVLAAPNGGPFVAVRRAAARGLAGWGRGTAAEVGMAGGFLASVAADWPAASVVLAGGLVVLLSRGAGAVSRGLGGQVAARLGRVSFAVYLVHAPLLIPFEGGWAWSGGWAGRLAACGAYAGLVAGMAVLAERWVERPGRAMAGPAWRRLAGVSRGRAGAGRTALPGTSVGA